MEIHLEFRVAAGGVFGLVQGFLKKKSDRTISFHYLLTKEFNMSLIVPSYAMKHGFKNIVK